MMNGKGGNDDVEGTGRERVIESRDEQLHTFGQERRAFDMRAVGIKNDDRPVLAKNMVHAAQHIHFRAFHIDLHDIGRPQSLVMHQIVHSHRFDFDDRRALFG